MRPLTNRQQQALRFFMTYLEQNQCQPSIRELGKALRVRSIRGATVHLDALVCKGYLQKTDVTPRGSYVVLKGVDGQPVNLNWSVAA